MFRAIAFAGANTLISAILVGFTAIVLIVIFLFSLRRSTGGAKIGTTPEGDDLLAQAEETALVTSVVKSIQERRETAGATTISTEGTEATEAPFDAAEIDWEERDDIYRPTIGDAAIFMHSFGLERLPDLEPEHSYIFIRQLAYAQLREHLRQDLTVELGGLLYGEAFRDPARSVSLLTIEAALSASEGIETATSFAYTQASWQALTPRLQQLDPAWTLIGSYHSHPGLGVFLSTTDLDTQETIFAQNWQIALVVDPVADELGFFVGKEGIPCPHWCILPDRN